MEYNNKATTKITAQSKVRSLNSFGQRDYYFHPDDDFREDWNWGKTKSSTIEETADLKNELSNLQSY